MEAKSYTMYVHACLNFDGRSVHPSLLYSQTDLLVDHIKTLQRVLKPGSKRLNWNSLGIQDYITKCEQVDL